MKKIVILAAGKGKRMGAEIPKVLIPIKGKPMIEYLIESIIASGVDDKPILVVAPDNIELFKKTLSGYDCLYALQDQPLGTGHALSCAKDYLENADGVISFYGDHPFVKPETIKRLSDCCSGVITMMTTEVNKFDGWELNFIQWGRIVRKNDEIEAIVEYKDASEEIKSIKEVNPGFYCFNNEWLQENIDKLKNNNAQGEYYITDLVHLAFEQGHKIKSIKIDTKEAMGINSQQELEIAKKII